MFSEISRSLAPPRKPAGSIVLVANELNWLGYSGGIGTSNWLLAHLLARHGWQVHILYCGNTQPAAAVAKVREQLKKSGIGLTDLEELPMPALLRLSGDPDPNADRSERVRRALEVIAQTFPFELVQFPEWQGLGFRTVQAKRAGTAFAKTGVLVKLHRLSQWMRCSSSIGLSSPDELMLDFYERRSFEDADFPMGTSQSLLDSARSIAWHVLDGVPVVPEPLAGTTAEADQHNRRIVEFYGTCLEKVRETRSGPGPVASKENTPLVTVAVIHFNLGAFLPQALASLAVQTYPNCEVLVLDDGSTDPTSRRVFAEQERLYPQFRFIGQANSGVCAARNRLLAEAKGEFFFPFDADDVAMPNMIECLVSALTRNPDHAVMTCYALCFDQATDPIEGPYRAAIRPPGGPHILGCVRNVYGCSCGLFRTQAMRAVGGYDLNPANNIEDRHLYIRLVNQGYRLGVVPDHLFYCRVRATSRSRAVSNVRGQQHILREFVRDARLSEADRIALWSALAGWYHQLRRKHVLPPPPPLRYRLADRMNQWVQRVPLIHHWGRKTILTAWNAWRALGGRLNTPTSLKKMTGREA